MKITLFGAIWIVLTIYCFFSKDEKKMIFITLLSTVLQCDAVVILNAENSVGPMIITSIVFIIWYFFKNFSKYMVIFDKTMILSMLFLSSIFISLISNGKSIFGDKLLYILQLIIYILCFWSMRKVGIKKNIDINKVFLPVIFFVLVVGILQYLIYLGILPRLKIITDLIYNETWELTNAYNTEIRLRLFSSFKEPSYCSAFLVGAFYYVCFNYEKIKMSKIIIIIIAIEIILTLSTTGYVSLIVVGIIFAISSHKKKLLNFLIPLAFLCVIFALFSGSLNIVIFNKKSTGSATERTLWNTTAYGYFKTSPIFGIGYRSYWASSIIYDILCNLGIYGFITYILFVSNYLIYIIKNKKNTINYGCLYFLLVAVFCQVITCPDIELCVFWLAIYLVGLTDYKYIEQGRKKCKDNNIKFS